MNLQAHGQLLWKTCVVAAYALALVTIGQLSPARGLPSRLCCLATCIALSAGITYDAMRLDRNSGQEG